MYVCMSVCMYVCIRICIFTEHLSRPSSLDLLNFMGGPEAVKSMHKWNPAPEGGNM